MTERRLPLFLGAVLVCAQLLLAWHTPSHIDTDLSHAQSVQECHLGGHAHSPALPGQCPELVADSGSAATPSIDRAEAPVTRILTVLARGPPTC